MNTAIIRLTLLLLTGICVGFYLEWVPKMSFLVLLSAVILFLIAYFRTRNLLFPDPFFGSSAFLLFFSLGMFISSLHLPQNQPQHYIHQISSEEIPLLKTSITESLKPDLYNHKFIAEVASVNQKPSHGKLLLLIPKDSLKMPFLEGEQILVFTQPVIIPPPHNPHQFDYSEFMEHKGVLRQANLQHAAVHKRSSPAHGIRATAANFRRKITSSLRQNNFGEHELAIVQALLLGQKQDISAETYNNYAAAGAIHILAVSGLHVGIILMLLHWLFKPLKRFKNGKIAKTLLIILSLWGFAVLAGLSPSVVRAVTMFSFIAVGLEINRRTSILNSLFLSLLLLLLIKPQWIFEVGFQLSYLAVLSIVLLQPLFSRLFTPSNRVVKYIYELLTVTAAAQIGVLPLSLYYFHQFPGLFFLTNLLILPFLGIILLLGILLMILAVLDILPFFYVQAYERLIKILNSTVDFIAKQEQFLFKDIFFSAAEIFTWYSLIFLSFLVWQSFSFRRLAAVLASVIVLQSVYLHQKAATEDRFIVFHKSRSSIIAKKEGSKLQIFHNFPEKAADIKLLQNYRIGENISHLEEKPLKNIYFQKGHFLILLDSTGFLPEVLPQNYSLILSGSPRVNLDRLLTVSRPQRIIADGSNYPSVVGRWKETASNKEISFHYTAEDGALILD